MTEKCRWCGSEYGHSDDCAFVRALDAEECLDEARVAIKWLLRDKKRLIEEQSQLCVRNNALRRVEQAARALVGRATAPNPASRTALDSYWDALEQALALLEKEGT